MKPILFLMGLIVLSLGISGGQKNADAGVYVAGSISSPNVAVSLSYFHDELAPYGRWVDVAPYGSCWSPNDASDDWRPYWDGNWAYTDYGWTWASNEPYGWATYHYGRWVMDPYYGWVWIPDTTWGPAWVNWQYNDAWCGWAPLPPQAGWSLSVGFSWGNNYGYAVPAQSWCFVPRQHFCDYDVRYQCAPVYRNASLCDQTRNVSRWSKYDGKPVNRGFNVSDVERWTGKRVDRQNVADLRPRNEGRDFAQNGRDNKRFNSDQRFNRDEQIQGRARQQSDNPRQQERQFQGRGRQQSDNPRQQERQFQGRGRQQSDNQRQQERQFQGRGRQQSDNPRQQERQFQGRGRQQSDNQRQQEQQFQGRSRQYQNQRQQEQQFQGRQREMNNQRRMNQEQQFQGRARQYQNQRQPQRQLQEPRRQQNDPQYQERQRGQSRGRSTVVENSRPNRSNDAPEETANVQNGKGHGRGRGH